MPSILSNKDKLQEAIENTDSTSEALVYLGLRNAGGNFKQFHKYVKQFGLQEKKYKYKRNKLKFTYENLEACLAENTIINSSRLKRRLVESGLFQNKCSECGVEPIWNNKPLSLQLDHINGIHTDNRIENLRILCPNCHTQTHTFGSRNATFNKVSYICISCNKPRVKGAKSELCYLCFSRKRRKVPMRPEKEILRKQIEELGYCGTARLYNVSDNAIRKWLK